MKNLQKFESVTDLQTNYKETAEKYFLQRFSDNPEFQKKFMLTFSDMVFSLPSETLDDLVKMRPNTLLNAVYKATEIGASFAKKQVHLLPFSETKKEKNGDVIRTVNTGFFNATLIVDINFQKELILNLPNCKKFFTAQVKEGVKVIEDLNTGNYIFDGENDASKATVGYYACFITKENEKYDLFYSNSEITDRAKMNPHFKEGNYKNANNNIHFEKIVVRNLLKIIPKTNNQLEAILSFDEVGSEFAEAIIIEDKPKVNELEKAKKELSENDKSKSDNKESANFESVEKFF